MRTFGITLAVVGVAAAVATFALNTLPSSINLHKHTHNHTAQVQVVDNTESEFQKFAAAYGKNYNNVEEYQKRLEIFRQNKQEHAKLNSMNSGAQFGVTQFSDWSLDEFKEIMGARYTEMSPDHHVHTFDETAINGAIDWRQHGVINEVKNQGGCGSCWAFSATASVESMHAIRTGSLQRLSEQEVVDCSHTYNYGCSGGMYDRAWSDIQKLGGFQSEQSYPYTQSQGSCRFNGQAITTPTGYRMIPSNDPEQIKAALVNGPVSIALSAGNSVFQNYRGGVISGSAGCPTQIDHAVVAIGWGNEGQDYFIVRNSWGAGWGESGYIRLASSYGAGTCGMNQYPAQVSTN